jgi:predicted metal-dependent peptidase
MSNYKTNAWAPDPNITDEALEVMRKDVLEKIVTARIGLLLRQPFFGNLGMRLKIVCGDGFIPTAATDGRNMYYNTQFFNALSIREIEFVVAHEIYHCVYDHLGRREERDSKLYNIAADYVVNGLLERDRIGEPVKLIQIYMDRKYDGWTSEEVYAELLEKHGSSEDEMLKQLGQMLDEHLDWESSDGEDDGEGEKSATGKPSYSKETLRRIRDEMREAMISAAQAAGAGKTPEGVQRMIKELTESKMNWRELIRQQVQSTMKHDFTFARPSRKGQQSGAILPGMNFMDRVDIAVGIDMSGSIGTKQATDFMSEIKGIIEEFQDYAIHVWCFDTAVYNDEKFSSEDGRDITEYDIKGGGGTDFDANWEFMKENDITPKKFIMFTDGYPYSSWGDEDYCDTLFIIHGHHDKNLEAPFGMTAHYDENA